MLGRLNLLLLKSVGINAKLCWTVVALKKTGCIFDTFYYLIFALEAHWLKLAVLQLSVRHKHCVVFGSVAR